MNPFSGLFGPQTFRVPHYAPPGYPWNFDLGVKFMRPKTGVDHWPARGNEGNLFPLGSFTVAPFQGDVFTNATRSAKESVVDPRAPSSFQFTVPVTMPALRKGSWP